MSRQTNSLEIGFHKLCNGFQFFHMLHKNYLLTLCCCTHLMSLSAENGNEQTKFQNIVEHGFRFHLYD